MGEHLYYLLKLLRPRQWTKNLALFAAITFGGQLFNADIFFQVVLGFITFCLLSSSTYIINDLFDVQKDKLHPFKKHRPIASGKVTIPEAYTLFVILVVASLTLAASLDNFFLIIAIFYILLQIFYSLFFKGMAIFDILIIAVGYILRVLAGEVISGVHISAWLLLTTISLSLFLAVGKRRSELRLLSNLQGMKIEQVRTSLSHYSEILLDNYSNIFATSTFIFYTIFTFLEDPQGIRISMSLLLPEFLPYYLQRKWLMITVIPVIYGLMRYMLAMYEKQEGESPDKLLMYDKALLSSVIIWAALVMFVIYFVGGA